MAIQGYNIYLNGVKKNASLITELTYNLSAIAAGTSHSVEIGAVDNHGLETKSNAVTFLTKPAQVTGVNASASSATAVALSWQAVTGAASYKIERKRTDGSSWTSIATGVAATSYNDNQGLSASTSYDYRMKAVNATGESVNWSATASATTQAGTPAPVTVVSPTSAQFAYTLYDEPADGYRLRSFASVLEVLTDAQALRIWAHSPVADVLGAGADSSMTILDANRKYLAYVTAVAGQGEQAMLTPNLPNPGTMRKFYIVESGNTQNGPTSFRGTHITRVEATTGTISIVNPVKETNLVAFEHDSIGAGDGSNQNSRYGWIPVLRGFLGTSWGAAGMGWGAKYTTGAYSTEALRQAAANRVAQYLQGATGRKIFGWLLGTNDFGHVVGDPAVVAQYAADVWDKVRALDSGIEIMLITPLWRSNKDTPNSGGWVLADYSAALKSVADTRNFVTYYEGLNILGSSHMTADGLHPNNAGHDLLARNIYSYITGLPLYDYVQEGEVIQETDPRLIYSGSWLNNTSGNALFRGGSIKYTQQNLAAVEVPFDGEQLALDLYADTSGGNFRAWIDGTIHGSYSLYSTTAKQIRIVLPKLVKGRHLVKLERQTGTLISDQYTVTDGTLTPTPTV